MANIAEASNAYAATLNKVVKPSAADAGAGSPAFGDLLKDSLQTAADAQHKSEKVSAQALLGKADMTDVLQAVTSAEVALNTVLAVRDRVVQAYNDVMRTQI